MTIREINELIEGIRRSSCELEDIYIENEGEVTEDAVRTEAVIDRLKELLAGEGIDALGRWLKAKEDELAAAKAEARVARLRVKSVENTVAYIKGRVGDALDALGEEKAKGSYYSFARSVSSKSSVDIEEINKAYLAQVDFAARKVGLPTCIDIVLKTTTTALNEAGLGEHYIIVDEAPAVRFGKPRKDKEEVEE